MGSCLRRTLSLRAIKKESWGKISMDKFKKSHRLKIQWKNLKRAIGKKFNESQRLKFQFNIATNIEEPYTPILS